MDSTVIIASIVVFLTITFLLVGMLLSVKARLMPSGPVKLFINGETDVEVSSGSTLLTTLGDNKIFLPSACGGGGTCIQCKCIVKDGGGEILPTEAPHFSRREIAEGWRLGCQVKVKEDMVIEVLEPHSTATYLGNALSLTDVHDAELCHRIKKVWAKFGTFKQELTDKAIPLEARVTKTQITRKLHIHQRQGTFPAEQSSRIPP